jgi:hypothetical protein
MDDRTELTSAAMQRFAERMARRSRPRVHAARVPCWNHDLTVYPHTKTQSHELMPWIKSNVSVIYSPEELPTPQQTAVQEAERSVPPPPAGSTPPTPAPQHMSAPAWPASSGPYARQMSLANRRVSFAQDVPLPQPQNCLHHQAQLQGRNVRALSIFGRQDSGVWYFEDPYGQLPLCQRWHHRLRDFVYGIPLR